MDAPVKLTKAEGIALAEALAARVGHAQVLTVLVATLGAQRGLDLVERQEGRITKAETVALVKAIIPLVPGDTRKAKIKVAIACLREAIPERERQDAILAYVLQKIKDYKVPPPVAPVAPVVNDGFLRLYGRVNMWCAGGEVLLRQDVTLCAMLGVGYQIEMAGWRSGQTAFDGEDKLAATCAMYRKLQGWCKSAGIPLFVSITNWNITLTKYGNKGRPFASVVPAAKKLAECVFDCGGMNFVYVQPVAETGKDTTATNFEKWCGKLFKGWKLVYNGGSRPTKPAYGWTHFAYHPNSTADGGKAGGISISDTGTIIKQLAADGSLNGPGDPAKVAAWFAKAKAAGAIVAGYYAFLREKHDAAAIRACAAPAAAQAAPQTGDDVDLSKAVWHGPDGRGAKVTETLYNLTFDGKEFRYRQSAGTSKWTPRTGEKNVNQYACFFVKRNGVWTGGKFDWSSETRSSRERTNIDNGYTGGIRPVAGEEVRFCLMDLNGTKRTNAPGVKWK